MNAEDALLVLKYAVAKVDSSALILTEQMIADRTAENGLVKSVADIFIP